MIKKALVFDDDSNIADIIKYLLEEKGWEVVCITNSNDVVNQTVEILPSIIFMDNNIPDYGGVAAIQKIKNTPAISHIPIVFCTGSANIQSLVTKSGADISLAKPFDITDIHRIIDNIPALKEL
jgi:two-component system alkaline phosphatase synthesis response regulator PhoP